MTREDIEQKWLVLGTDSKVGNRKGDLSAIAKELGLEHRNTVGEKGIGRLAIGVIGPQVLLLSRAKRVRESPKTVAVFVNWSLFEIPGVSLNENSSSSKGVRARCIAEQNYSRQHGGRGPAEPKAAAAYGG